MAQLLADFGIDLDVSTAVAHAYRDGMFVGSWGGMKIDVFVPSIPFSREAERTRIRVTSSDGWTGWFLSAEGLTIFKLLFFRGKDLVDLERLVAVRGDALDHAYIRDWIIQMMGEDDVRVARWDELVARFAPHDE